MSGGTLQHSDSLRAFRTQVMPLSQLDSLMQLEAQRRETCVRSDSVSRAGVQSTPVLVPKYDSVFPYPIRNPESLWVPFLSHRPAALAIPDTVHQLVKFPTSRAGYVFTGGTRATCRTDAALLFPSTAQNLPRGEVGTTNYSNALTLLWLGVIVLMVTIVRISSWPRLKAHLAYLLRGRLATRPDRDASVKQKIFYIFSDLLFIASVAFFGWMAIPHCDFVELTSSPPSHTLFFLCAFFIARYLIQYLTLAAGSALINSSAACGAIWWQRQLLTRTLWLVFLPLNLVLAYTNPSAQIFALRIGVVLLVLTLIFGWVRVATTFYKERYHPLYFFLYLCALELAPFLLAGKWLNLF